MYYLSTILTMIIIYGFSAMGMTEKEQKTLAFYDKEAEKFMTSSTKDNTPSFWDAELKEFNKLLPCGRILDIGAGKGREARFFIEAGYDYVGCEPAEKMRVALENTFPNHEFIKETIYDWHLPPESYDGFWCSAMLLHIPPQNLEFVLQAIKAPMKCGAIGFISLAEGDGEYFDADTGRYFYLYNQTEFTKILERNGFIIKKHVTRIQDTHRTWLRQWLVYYCQV